MDNTTQHDNLTPGEAIEAAWSVGKSVQEKLILKKAKKKIAAGKANELSGREIDICLEAGIDPKTFESNPKYMNRPEVIAAKAAAIKNSGSVATDQEAITAAKKEVANTTATIEGKKLLIPILAIIAIGLVIYFLSN